MQELIQSKFGLFCRENSYDEDILCAIINNEYGFRIENLRTLNGPAMDVGAHIGSFAKFLRNNGFNGNIYSYEAHPENFAVLEKNKILLSDDRFFIINGAVWRNSSEVLYITGDLEKNTGTPSVVSRQENKIQVKTISFDDEIDRILSETGFSRISLLKIDCEGSEYPILFNSKKLELVNVIVGEFHDFDTAKFGRYNFDDLQQFLISKGFKVCCKHNIYCPIVSGIFAAYRDCFDIIDHKYFVPSISGCMITFNEAENINNALENLSKFTDEIVIFDSYSTDDTQDIIKKYKKCKLYEYPIDNFCNQRNRCIDACRGDWVFFLDADELCDDELIVNIKDVICEAEVTGGDSFFIPCETTVNGKYVDLTFPIKLFKRRIRYIKEIHEQPLINKRSLLRFPKPGMILHHKTLEQQDRSNKIYYIMDPNRRKEGIPHNCVDIKPLDKPIKDVNLYTDILLKNFIWPDGPYYIKQDQQKYPTNILCDLDEYYDMPNEIGLPINNSFNPFIEDYNFKVFLHEKAFAIKDGERVSIFFYDDTNIWIEGQKKEKIEAIINNAINLSDQEKTKLINGSFKYYNNNGKFGLFDDGQDRIICISPESRLILAIIKIEESKFKCYTYSFDCDYSKRFINGIDSF